jgi:hypothetical protein
MKVDNQTRDILLKIQAEKKISLEGNILKIIEAESDDKDFQLYLKNAIDKDKSNRLKRLDVTKQVQNQNRELLEAQERNENLMNDIRIALDEAENAKEDALKAKDEALIDLDVLQKKSQTELIGTIVKVALFVIIGVGAITTIMYGIAMMANKDTQIIGSTWSNMFGILLTNAFSIVGTIMGVKYASEKKDH